MGPRPIADGWLWKTRDFTDSVIAWERSILNRFLNGTADSVSQKLGMEAVIQEIAFQSGFGAVPFEHGHQSKAKIVVGKLLNFSTSTTASERDGEDSIRASPSSLVVVTYRNRQVGQRFGAWNKHGKFSVSGVIRGWQHFLLSTCVSSVGWEVYIPWQLAYGVKGKPKRIPPYTALVFQMKVEKVLTHPTKCP